MRYGIITDIHSNYEALSVAVSQLIEDQADVFLCMGDIVGYNASPREVIDLLMDLDVVAINGNHDRYLMGQKSDAVADEKLDVIEWTRNQLSPEQRAWLERLPEQTTYEGVFLIAHGSPRDKDEYLLTKDAINGSMQKFSSDFLEQLICFFGHTHLPMVVGGGRVDAKFQETRSLRLERGKRYLINVGSVGQPRDRCPLTAFGMFDSETWTLKVYRQEYNRAVEQEKILAAGLDRRLANRLNYGV